MAVVVREVPDTEASIVDFTGELLFAWWIALYRPGDQATLELRSVRNLSGNVQLPTLPEPRPLRNPTGSGCGGFGPVLATYRARSYTSTGTWNILHAG